MAYLGEDIPKLGFGMMRLPKNGEDFDIPQICKMVDAFLAAGFKYFDTAFVYPGSEEAIKKALVERHPRDSYYLATKNAAWHAKDQKEAEEQLNISLQRCGVDYFDFYLLHNVNINRVEIFDNMDMWNFVKRKKEEGVIKHIGFSFHDSPELLDRLLTDHPEVEFVQLQINYADWEHPMVQSGGNYEVCRKHNIPIVIMEPVKGGMLANPPEQVKAVFQAAEPDSTPASWALRFAADLDGLVTVLSGMSTYEQMEDNLKTMKDFRHFNDSQRETLQNAVAELKKIPLIQCTSCNYCATVCPQNIGISAIFSARNMVTLFNNVPAGLNRIFYDVERYEKGTAKDCIGCHACESVCPQKLAIPDLLAECKEVFGK